MIPGLSGTILSHDALEAANLTTSESAEAAAVHRLLLRWQLNLSRNGGPAWTARKVFDEVASPFCTALGFQIVPVVSDPAIAVGLLQAAGDVVALAIARPWGQELGTVWRESVRRAIGAGVRWCYCFNGASLRLFDAARTHSRRYIDLDVERITGDPVTFAVTWRLLRAAAFAGSHHSQLDRAVVLSERHRADVRDALQSGVHDALARLTTAFLKAARRRRTQATGTLLTRQAYDESLLVIYRVLFLLFAEARGLVPNWHPVFRESYTVEALRPIDRRRAQLARALGSAASDRAAGPPRLPGRHAARPAVQWTIVLSGTRSSGRHVAARRPTCSRRAAGIDDAP